MFRLFHRWGIAVFAARFATIGSRARVDFGRFVSDFAELPYMNVKIDMMEADMKPLDLVVDRWGARFLGRRFACAVGRGGITARKREGDGASPIGTHPLIGMLYRADRMTRPADWARPIGPFDLWSDDPSDRDYNLPVRAPHPFGHEALFRADPLYDLILLTDWNWPHAQAGHGSAIFIHQWRAPRYPTAGCVAFDRHDLRWIAARLKPQSRVIIRG